jgi:multiple sugar transport system substrate-binding protein
MKKAKAIARTTLAVIVIVIIVIAGAGAYLALSSMRPSVTTSTAAVTQLTYWGFGGIPSEHDYLGKLVGEFNAQYTNIHVTWVEKSWETKVPDLESAFASGAAPDVVSLDTASRFTFVGLGAYLPISTDFPSIWQNMTKYYIPEILPTVEVNGTYYGVPTYFDGAPFLAYNTAMFEKAGITQAPATWSQLVADAQKIQTQGIAKWGFTFPATAGTNDVELYLAIVYQDGGRMLSPDGKTVEINSAAWVNVLQFYHDLIYKYSISPLPTGCDYFCAGRYFFDNQSAMYLGFSWVPAIQSSFNVSMTFPYALTRFPLPDTIAGPYPSAAMVMDPTTTFYIMSSTKNAQAAMTFVQFMFNQAVALGGWGPENGIYGRAPVSTTIFTQTAFQQAWPALYSLYQSGTLFTGAQPMPSFPAFTKMMADYIPTAVSAALTNTASPQDALNTAESGAQAYLSSGGG